MTNKITAGELEQHLNGYLDKVDDGENVIIEYEREYYKIIKLEDNSHK